MAIPEDLQRAVDDVLGPAWEKERRRALRRFVASTAGRVLVGLAALWVLGLVAFALTGAGVPWDFFAVTAVLFAAAALTERDNRAHLRRR